MCDRYRNDNYTWIVRENRYFIDSELNLSISYFQFFWGRPSKGINSSELNLTDCNEGSGCAQAPCSIGNCLVSHWVAQKSHGPTFSRFFDSSPRHSNFQ